MPSEGIDLVLDSGKFDGLCIDGFCVMIGFDSAQVNAVGPDNRKRAIWEFREL